MTFVWPSWVDPLPFPFPELHNYLINQYFFTLKVTVCILQSKLLPQCPPKWIRNELMESFQKWQDNDNTETFNIWLSIIMIIWLSWSDPVIVFCFGWMDSRNYVACSQATFNQILSMYVVCRIVEVVCFNRCGEDQNPSNFLCWQVVGWQLSGWRVWDNCGVVTPSSFLLVVSSHT